MTHVGKEYRKGWVCVYVKASLVAQMVRNLPAVHKTWVQSLTLPYVSNTSIYMVKSNPENTVAWLSVLLLNYICCSAAQSCLTLCDPMNCSTPGFPVLHYFPEFAQIHIY